MRYLADILTLIRFALAVLLCVWAAIGGAPEWAFIIFVTGELTDAFDGYFATKYPFPKSKIPKYRKYAAKYDMFIDIFLGVAMNIYFIARVNLVAGLIILIGYGGMSIVIDLIAYGKVFGHPDDCSPHSLVRRDFPLAKKILLTRRMAYVIGIAIVAAWTFYASSWSIAAKIIVTVIAAVVSLFLWFFLAQRRHHISRDAVDIEQQLSKKSRK